MNRELVLKTLDVLRSLEERMFWICTFKGKRDCETVHCVFGHMVARDLIPNVNFGRVANLIFKDTQQPVTRPEDVMEDVYGITNEQMWILFFQSVFVEHRRREATLKVMIERWEWLLQGKDVIAEEERKYLEEAKRA